MSATTYVITAFVVVALAFVSAQEAGLIECLCSTDGIGAQAGELLSSGWSLTICGAALLLEGNSNGIGGRPSPELGERMARRRYQRGALRRESGKWVLRWRDDVLEQGEVKRVERRAIIGTVDQFPTKPLARRAADQMLGHINPVDYRPGRVITVPEFAELYLSDTVPMMKRTSQISVRAIVRRHIVPFFGACRLDEVRGRLPQAFVVALRSKGLKRKTVLNAVSVLSRMLETAAEYGYLCTKLDHGTLNLPPDDLETEARFFTPAEAQMIVDNAEGEWKVCFALMAYLGLRCGEALGLAWEHVDLETGVLRVRQAAVMGAIQTVKSKTSKRDVPLPTHLIGMLRGYRATWQPNDSGLLFISHTGKPYWATNVRLHRFYPLLERLGIPRGGLHAFRHGHATNMFTAGAAAPTVRDTLGHASINTTLRYTHRVTEEQRRAIESVSASMLRHSAANGSRKLLRIK